MIAIVHASLAAVLLLGAVPLPAEGVRVTYLANEGVRIDGGTCDVLIDALFRWLSDFHVDLVSVPGLEQLTLAEHREILAAITRADAEGAARAMGDHLMRANELYRQSHLTRR